MHVVRSGAATPLVVEGPEGLRVYSLEGAGNTYRVLIEAMNEGAATLTEAGVITCGNSRLAELLGLPLQQVMGRSIKERVPPRHRASFDAMVKMAAERESREEISLLNTSGEEIPTHVSLNTIEAEGQKVVCMVAVDLRPAKRTEEIMDASSHSWT